MKESIPLSGKQMAFRQRRSSNSIFLLILLMLIVGSLYLLRSVWTRQIISPFEETPIPTRTVDSFTLEGETHFKAGDLPNAITAFSEAARLEPKNAQVLAELARIQAYSSATLASDSERLQRIEESIKSIDSAVTLTPDDSTVNAIHAFVLDWYASILQGQQTNVVNKADDKVQQALTEAEQAAVRALQLDPRNALAMAYYAEILLDQQKWVQAEQYISNALDADPSIMDVHRIRAIVQETGGNYAEAIKEYKLAADINPNLTFLYIRIGINYRQLRQYDEALKWFNKAATIDKQLNIKDPTPNLAIAKTYSQTGDFFAAALNVKAALKLNPTSPEVYGSLGVVYFKSRNYESAIPALACAVRGCDANTSCLVREGGDTCTSDDNFVIQGMPLTNNTVVYYYTYGSVLAGMHRQTDPIPLCAEAVTVLKEIRQAFANDNSIISIIAPSEEICASYGYR